MQTQNDNIFDSESKGRFNRAYTPEEDEKSDLPVFLTDTDELRDILSEVAERMRVAPEDRERVKGFRTRVAIADWTVTNLQNRVTKEIFDGHAEAAIHGAIRDVVEGQGQNNGSWMVLDYKHDVAIRRGTREKKLVLRLTLVDTTNSEDLRFENGKLITGTGVGPAQALKALGGSFGSDPEVKALLIALTKHILARDGIAVPEPAEVKEVAAKSVAEAEADAMAIVAQETAPPVQRPDRPKVAVMIPPDKAPRKKPGPPPGYRKAAE